MRRRGLHHPPPLPPHTRPPSPLLFFTVPLVLFHFVQFLSSPSFSLGPSLAAYILSRLSFFRFVFLPFFLPRSYSPPYLRISLFLSLPFILPLCFFHPHTVFLILRATRGPPKADTTPRTLTCTPLNHDTRVFFACVTLSTWRRRRRSEISSRTWRSEEEEGKRKGKSKGEGRSAGGE